MKTLSQVKQEIGELITTMLTFPKREHKTTLYRRLKNQLEERNYVRHYLEYAPTEDSVRKQYMEVKRIVDMVDAEMKSLKDDPTVTQFKIEKRRGELEKIHSYKLRKKQKETLEYILEI